MSECGCMHVCVGGGCVSEVSCRNRNELEEVLTMKVFISYKTVTVL